MAREPEERASTTLTQTVARGTSFATAGFVASRALTFATYVVLARLAAPAVFGEFAAATVVVGISSAFVDSGMMAALIQRRDRVDDAASTALAATASGGIVLGLVAFGASPLVGRVFDSAEIGHVAAAMAGVLLIGSIRIVPDTLLQRRFSFLRRVLVDPLGVIAFGVASIVGLGAGLGIWALVLGTYASEATMTAAAWIACRWRPRRSQVSFAMWRELASYGRFVLAGSFVDRVYSVASTVLVGRIVGAGGLGQYRYAMRLAVLPHEVVVNTASYVLLPAFARMTEEPARFAAAYRRSLHAIMLLVLPTAALFVPLGRPLVLVLFGRRWEPAGDALVILSFWGAARAAGSVSSAALKAAGRPQFLPVLHLIDSVLQIGLMLALVRYGLRGIAAGAAAGTVASQACAVWSAARVAGVPPAALVRDVAGPAAAAVVTIATLLPIESLVVHAAEHGPATALALLAAEAALGVVVSLAAVVCVAPRQARQLGAAVWPRARVRLARRHPSVVQS